VRRLHEHAAALGESVPSIDDHDQLMAWARTSGPLDAHGLGRYLTQLWRERPDLQEEFPGVFMNPSARTEFLRWVHHFGSVEAGVPPELIPAEPAPLPEPTPLEPPSFDLGVTCVAYHRAVLGVGAAGRRLAHLFEGAGERVHRRTYDHTTAPLRVPFVETDAGGTSIPRLDVIALCVNGSETPRLSQALGPEALEGRYRIGLWGWELEVFPREQQAGFDFVDEVWTYSAFARDAIARVAPPHIPVHSIALGADLRVGIAPTTRSETSPEQRVSLGLPASGNLIGFAFDYASSIERKNPEAVVRAYCLAVPDPVASKQSLVIKTLNADEFGTEHKRLLDSCQNRLDIVIVDSTFSNDEQQAFMNSLCAYVSLHRSEGYGLTLLEAMAAGIPVIATAYSGNLDFMNSINSWLIPYRLVATTGSGQYPEGLLWAEADTDAAAAAIREVLHRSSASGSAASGSASGSAEVRAKTRQAQRDAAALIDPTGASIWIAKRLREIRSARLSRVTRVSQNS
jgi:glycosyltransferase involved in cell wall biosynthesis